MIPEEKSVSIANQGVGLINENQGVTPRETEVSIENQGVNHINEEITSADRIVNDIKEAVEDVSNDNHVLTKSIDTSNAEVEKSEIFKLETITEESNNDPNIVNMDESTEGVRERASDHVNHEIIFICFMLSTMYLTLENQHWIR